MLLSYDLSIKIGMRLNDRPSNKKRTIFLLEKGNKQCSTVKSVVVIILGKKKKERIICVVELQNDIVTML